MTESTIQELAGFTIYGMLWLFPFMIITCVLGLVLHLTLPRRLDPVLFRAPYFQQQELRNYRIWPLTMIKTINYIGLLAWPRVARRFKGFNNNLPVSKAVKAVCKVQMSLMIFVFLSGMLVIAMGALVVFQL